MSLDLTTAADAVRPWISTGFLGAIVLLIARLGKPVADYLIETHKLRAQEKKDDRQGYAELIEIQQKSLDALTREVHELRNENTEMRNENAMMRRELRELHGLIDGMRRGDMQARQSAQVVELHALPPGSIPPATAAALDRMQEE